MAALLAPEAGKPMAKSTTTYRQGPRITTPLTRLERVPLREAWRHGAGDFTPWLAEEDNLAMLAKVPGPSIKALITLLTTLPAAYAVQAGGWVPGMREVLGGMGAGFMVDAAVIWPLCWRKVWLEAPAARPAAQSVYTGVS